MKLARFVVVLVLIFSMSGTLVASTNEKITQAKEMLKKKTGFMLSLEYDIKNGALAQVELTTGRFALEQIVSIYLGVNLTYFIYRLSQSCLLKDGKEMIVPVSCQALKKSFHDAAPFITWVK